MPKLLAATCTIAGYTLTGTSFGVLNPVTVTGSIDLGASAATGALYAQGPGAWTVTNGRGAGGRNLPRYRRPGAFLRRDGDRAVSGFRRADVGDEGVRAAGAQRGEAGESAGETGGCGKRSGSAIA